MFTTEQADYLIHLPKKIFINENLIDKFHIQQRFPFRERFILGSQSDVEYTFLLEIFQSEKASLKVSLYHQEDQSKIGLLRIDFYGTHRNPVTINEVLPSTFHKYAGKWFNYNEHHIHFYFEDYKPLAWALPLIEDEFPIKDIKNNQDVGNAFISFCKRINLVTEIQLESILI